MNSLPGPVTCELRPFLAATVRSGPRMTSVVSCLSGTSPVDAGATMTWANSRALAAIPLSMSTAFRATSAVSREAARSTTIRLIDGCRSYQLRVPWL